MFVGLLRGINVSGHNQIPMAELRSLCEELKWKGVQTYIQSGNLIFAADGAPAEIERQLEQSITKRFGHTVPAIVRAASDWPSYIKTNPMAEACKVSAKSVMLVLSKHPPKPEAAEALQERAVNGERVLMAGNALWIHFADGVAKSKLSPALLDRLIGSTATARNWNTVLKINELIDSARKKIGQSPVSTQNKARARDNLMSDNRSELRRAIEADDLPGAEKIAVRHPDLLNCTSGQPLVTRARSVAMAERLLSVGAEIGAVSKWWGGGIGVRAVDPTVAEFLIQRGAVLTVHAASALGLISQLEKLLDSDSSLIQAKGTDACSPLHFARNVPTAKVLVDRGAQLDARDEDHDSTPAQWLIGEAPEVSRWLVERGAPSDLFMAAAWGDRILAEKLISANRSCLSQWIGRGPNFNSIGYKQRGGTIYQWTLGFNSFPHQIALEKGHGELFDFLFEESDAKTQFLVSCLLVRREQAQSILAQNPRLIGSLDSIDMELLARYCWETNLHIEAVRLMHDLGFPISSPESAHGYTPLHNAAWAGDANLVELLLQRGHPVNITDPRYNSTPMNWALHDCLVEKRHTEGDFVRVVKLLLDAGSPGWAALIFPTGHAAIDELLRPKLSTKTSSDESSELAQLRRTTS